MISDTHFFMAQAVARTPVLAAVRTPVLAAVRTLAQVVVAHILAQAAVHTLGLVGLATPVLVVALTINGTDPLPTVSNEPAIVWVEAANDPADGVGHFGFHSRASFCASAICSGVILDATKSRALIALSRSSWFEAGRRETARFSHMCART